MNTLIWMLVWLLALALGSVVTAISREEERRWAAVGSLMLALAGAVGLGTVTQLGQQPASIGPFTADAITTTVAPAMLLGALALVLAAGRIEASGRELSWLLAVLGTESVALLSGSFGWLLAAEAATAIILAEHARRRGHRAHTAYLWVSAMLMLAAGAVSVGQPNSAISAGLVAAAALLRLGIFPFSTGMLASLQHGPTTATLLASLPFGGVLLLLRSNHLLADAGFTRWLIPLLLVSAPLAAALAVNQRHLGRSLGYLLAAIHAMIALGTIDLSMDGQLGGELLWSGALLTGTGFAAACNLVSLRVGNPDLEQHHGLHHSAPVLSLGFLVLGVGLAGAPGTIHFVAEDILLNTASAGGTLGIALIIITIALVAYNVFRLQFRLFFGPGVFHTGLEVKGRERLGLSLVAAAVVFGGLAPGLLPLLSSASAVSGH